MDDRHLEAPWVGKTPEEYYGYKEQVADRCQCCDGDIMVGEEYYDIDGTIICEECIDEYRKTAESKE
ncbi:MAG: hypothetical protein IKA99_06615 [Clostridia bacterium]|nr:hypothetical protein [Clostridia bacterium]